MTNPDFPAPLAHTPRVAEETNVGYFGIILREESGAWLHCENPVEVRR